MNDKNFWSFAHEHPWLTYFTVGSLITGITKGIPACIKAIRGVSDTYITNNYSSTEEEKEEKNNE